MTLCDLSSLPSIGKCGFMRYTEGQLVEIPFKNMTDIPELDRDNMDVEVIEPSPAQTERSIARRLALQILYEIDSARHPLGEVLTAQLSEAGTMTSKTQRHVRALVQAVAGQTPSLDAYIQPFAPEFSINQLSIIDRNILRMAVAEMVLLPNMPLGVIIAEAVELANVFGSDGSTRFINGALAMIADNDRDAIRKLFPSEELDVDASET
jgi:transcription antitermination protein NusB